MSMRSLIILIAISYIFCYLTVDGCKNYDDNGDAIIPNSEEECTLFDMNSEEQDCCYVSWKNQGKYYAMCRSMPRKDKEGEIKKLKKELKKEFEDIHIMCSSKYIYFSLFLTIMTCLIL